MMNTGIENEIRYRLVKASDVKRDTYRAVLKHDALSARETLDEICKATYLPQHLIEHAIGGTLDTMIRRTLGDGRTRRFGDWFETRCDILGRFDRIDEAFDPARHKVAVNLLPLSEFDQYGRKNPPVNERQQVDGELVPRGVEGLVDAVEPSQDVAARLEPVAEAPRASVAEGAADHRVERPADRTFNEVPRKGRCRADLVERCACGQRIVLQHGTIAVAFAVACLDEAIANVIFDSSIHHRIPFGFRFRSPSGRASQVTGDFRRSHR